ncbi:hydrogenase maturation nickel metallochaperone HypA [candidate division KSB1 bacterium]
MHEFSIATDLIDLVISSMTEYPGAKVKSITVSVGILSGVDPEALQFCFPEAAKGTHADGAELILEMVPLIVDCPDCATRHDGGRSLKCPKCGSGDVTVCYGKDLILSTFDIDIP